MKDRCHIAYHQQTPEELASEVLQDCFGSNVQFPVDPFKILRQYNVFYSFRDFHKIEGLYIVPGESDDVAVVGINIRRPIARQRYTAAHELCHHIKDRETIYCSIAGKSKIERYAENFAAALLMPIDEFRRVANGYAENGIVSFDNALRMAEYFGVSFMACIYRLAYSVHMLGEIAQDNTLLSKQIKKYKPEKKKLELGYKEFNITLYDQIINSLPKYDSAAPFSYWLKAKNEFIYNENRIEKLNVSREQVAEILTDIRFNSQKSIYYQPHMQEFVEVAGHSDMFDFIYDPKQDINILSCLRLHQIFYRYSPCPEAGGSYKQANNLITRSNTETCDYKKTPGEMQKVMEDAQSIVRNSTLSDAEFLMACVRIHYRITSIHPFPDGNGRVSRAFFNWMLRYRNFPMIYIDEKRKFKYYDALEIIDAYHDFDKLFCFFLNELLRAYSDFHQLSSKHIR